MSESQAPQVDWEDVLGRLLAVAGVPEENRQTPEEVLQCLLPVTPQQMNTFEVVCRLEGVFAADDPAGEVLTGSHLSRLVEQLKEQGDRLRRRAMDRAQPEVALSPETVPLEIAAAVLYRHLYPQVQERFQIAIEMTGETLQALMLGTFSRFSDSVRDADMTDVPDVARRPGASLRPAGTALPGPGALADGMVPVCECCGDEIPQGFDRLKQRPRARYHKECGDFAYACQTWAGNVARYPEMADRPLPDPYDKRLPMERWERVKTWQAVAIPRLVEAARLKARQMPGAA